MRVSPKIILSLFLFLLLTTRSILAQGAALNADPDFDNYDANPAGPWLTFRISNPGPSIWKNAFEGWPKGPSLHVYRDKQAFDGGVYQVVNVTPGRGYHFEVAWASVRFAGGNGPQDPGRLGRQIGFDPYGGTNPLAPSVVWSAEHRGSGKFPDELKMDQYARAPKITIFIRARNEYTEDRAEVFFDHAVLTENTGMGVITVAPPTPTSAPPTATRPASPTTARTRAAQAPAATATTQPSPTSTLIPTNTVQPTVTRTRGPTATIVPEAAGNAPGGMSLLSIVIAVAVLGAVGVGLLVFGFVIFRLLGRTA